MEKNFYINDRFLIEPDVNLVTDQLTQMKTRLEARLMQLLLMLVEKQGKTIMRDELVTSIWNDYGGGDEGLTQAISILRKVFDDTQKELIQTIPKKGYVLNAVIRYEADKIEAAEENKKPASRFQKKWLVALLAVVIVAGVLIVYVRMKSAENISSASTNVPYPTDMTKEELLEENATNTISTQAPDSTIYKLVSIRDQPPKFYINNKRLLEGDWEPYMPVINSLKRQLAERKKAAQ